jgi:hypothetical protein
MIIIAKVIEENDDEIEIKVIEANAPFDITKVKGKLYITKDGKYILTKAKSFEIFENGICIKKINYTLK